MRSGFHGGLRIVVLCAAASLVHAQPRENQEPDPAALFAQARPYLEEALGLRLERLPRFKVVAASALRELREPELETQIRWQFPDLQGESLARVVGPAVVVEHGARVALYDPSTDTILLVPEIARQMAAWDESLATADSIAFLQLSLVHETVRLFLQQRYDLVKRQSACRDGEEFQALQAVIAGRAQWVTRQVTRRLGTEAYFPLLARCYLHVPDTLPDLGLRAVSQESLRRRHSACVQGLAFFDYLEQHGFRDAEAKVFAHPPRQVAWVKQPELYLQAQRSGRADLADTLVRVTTSMPAAEWNAIQQPWTPDMVCQAASLLGERQRAEKIVTGWDEARSLIWTGKTRPDRQVAVGVVRFQDTASARGYYNFALELQRKQDELLGTACSNGRRTVESKFETVRLRHAEEAVRSDKQFQFGPESKPTAVSQLWVRAGTKVIEFTWQGLPGDPAWAEQVLDVLLPDAQR
jgi:hypothetical protein